MAKKANLKRTVYLTDRALRDIAGIELHSIEDFGSELLPSTLVSSKRESVASLKTAIFFAMNRAFTSRSNSTALSSIYWFAKRELRARSSS